jgi:hypothetical protein
MFIHFLFFIFLCFYLFAAGGIISVPVPSHASQVSYGGVYGNGKGTDDPQ